MLIAAQNGIAFSEQHAAISAELGRLPSQQAVAQFAAKAGMDAIRTDPMRYVFLHLMTIPTNLLPCAGDWLRTFGVKIGGTDTLSQIRSHGIVVGIAHYFNGNWTHFLIALPTVLSLALTYCAAATGLLQVRNIAIRVQLVLLIGTIGYFLIVPGGAALPRFRVPVAPAISILAALGWVATVKKLRRRSLNVLDSQSREFPTNQDQVSV